MEFALTGPHQGKTMKLGGFNFKAGVTEVPDDARDAHNLLSLHYGCHPSHTLELGKDGKLVKKEDAPALATLAGKIPVASEKGKEAGEEENLADLSVAELRVMASELKLDSSGKKDELIARIQDAAGK